MADAIATGDENHSGGYLPCQIHGIVPCAAEDVSPAETECISGISHGFDNRRVERRRRFIENNSDVGRQAEPPTHTINLTTDMPFHCIKDCRLGVA
tara:strand:+ start:250 stop:537 length:288 start_codon:yes stop_codon:yes gene_type:complete